jgi:hypothetical protein
MSSPVRELTKVARLMEEEEEDSHDQVESEPKEEPCESGEIHRGDLFLSNQRRRRQMTTTRMDLREQSE